MALVPPKFPRRHAQRQVLRVRNTASFSDIRSQNQHHRHRPRIARKHRDDDRISDSDLESDSDIDIDGEDKPDGYASDTDIEAEYLNGLVEKFREMGPQISNLGDVAREMIHTEKSIWQK
jgi:hypothetical protein